MHEKTTSTRAWTWALLLAMATAGGCASWDRHAFQSTPHRPATVTVVDAEQGERLWRLDVPPDHRLTLDLAKRGEFNLLGVSGEPATHMNWKLHRTGPATLASEDQPRSRRVNAGEVDLGERRVRIEVDYRPPLARRAPTAERPDEREASAESESESEGEPAAADETPGGDGNEPVADEPEAGEADGAEAQGAEGQSAEAPGEDADASDGDEN